MPDGYLTFDDGVVTLDGETVPGILVSVSIRGSVRFDEAEQDGSSGKVKTPMGWEDSDVSLALDLLTEEDSLCYDKLQQINALFQGQDSGGNPKVYALNNRHAQARAVDQVVFAGLQSMENDRNDIIRVSLNFVEQGPAVAAAEARAATSSQALGGGGTGSGSVTPKSSTTKNPDSDTKIVVDVT